MQIKDMRVELCERKEISQFIENNHYSQSINGVKSTYCFKLIYEENIIGAIIFGNLAMANQYKQYVSEEKYILELRRLCCIDDTPKNTESYFIGFCLRWLKKNTDVKSIVSYADPNWGHTGIIYRATNFKYMGTTSPGRMINFNGKLYHDKTIRTKYNGVIKPYALKIKIALELGLASYQKTLGKHIYLYNLQ